MLQEQSIANWYTHTDTPDNSVRLTSVSPLAHNTYFDSPNNLTNLGKFTEIDNCILVHHVHNQGTVQCFQQPNPRAWTEQSHQGVRNSDETLPYSSDDHSK